MDQSVATKPVMFDAGDDYPELREGVRELCRRFPTKYWRDLEGQPPSSSYPTEFVQALTDAGYLSALIPKDYGGWGLPIRGGSVILETIHRSGGAAGACHAQMYTMGTVLRHGSAEQKSQYLPQIAKGEDFADSANKVGIGYEALLQRIMNLGLRWQPESVA